MLNACQLHVVMRPDRAVVTKELSCLCFLNPRMASVEFSFWFMFIEMIIIYIIIDDTKPGL